MLQKSGEDHPKIHRKPSILSVVNRILKKNDLHWVSPHVYHRVFGGFKGLKWNPTKIDTSGLFNALLKNTLCIWGSGVYH